MPNGVRLQNRLSALPFGRSRRRGLEGRAVRGRDQEAMLWKSVRPGVGGSLRAGRRPLPSAPTISVGVRVEPREAGLSDVPVAKPHGSVAFPGTSAGGTRARSQEKGILSRQSEPE